MVYISQTNNMDHYTYKHLDLFWDYRMPKRAKAIKSNKYYKFTRKHLKKIIAVTAMMSFAVVLKTHLHA